MNFGTPVPLLIGIVLILGGVALFFLDKLKPGYGRDADKVYAVLWLISGVFLLGHLTMELLASFQQLLMAGMLIAVTIENIYSRTPKEDRYAPQGVSGGGRDDYYRPSRSPDYRGGGPRMNVRAELDNEGPYRPRFPEDRRMIGGREEPPRRSDYYDEGYGDRYADDRGSYGGERVMPPSERPVERLNPSNGDRIRRRRPKAGDTRYGSAPSRGWDDSATGYAANSGGGYSANSGGTDGGSYSANSGYSAASSDSYVGSGGYSSHSTSSPNAPSSDSSAGDDSYVDYRPVNNYPNDDSGKPPADYGSRY